MVTHLYFCSMYLRTQAHNTPIITNYVCAVTKHYMHLLEIFVAGKVFTHKDPCIFRAIISANYNQQFFKRKIGNPCYRPYTE